MENEEMTAGGGPHAGQASVSTPADLPLPEFMGSSSKVQCANDNSTKDTKTLLGAKILFVPFPLFTKQFASPGEGRRLPHAYLEIQLCNFLAKPHLAHLYADLVLSTSGHDEKSL